MYFFRHSELSQYSVIKSLLCGGFGKILLLPSGFWSSSPHGKWHRTFCNKQQSDTGRPREQKDYWIFKHYIEIVKTNVLLSQNLKFKMQNKTGKPVSFPGRWKGRVHPAHMHARTHTHTRGRANTRTHARTAFLCPTVFANYSLALVVGLKWEKGNRKDAQKWHRNDP